MSHIYEALRRASADSQTVERGIRWSEDTPRPPDRFALEHYASESRLSSDRPKRTERVAKYEDMASVAVAEQPSVAPLQTATAVTLTPADVDVEGKLVGGAGPTHVSVEQYRRLGAVLHDAQIESGLKTLMVTSALPGEGKTLTVVNLALTLSEAYGRRVLVIDADLRWPSVHQFLGVSNERGLSEALGTAGGELPLIEVSPRLTVLPSGRPGENPLAGLTSDRMRELLDECAARFDWVLLDTAPVGFLPDAQLLSRLTRAVVFVIGAGSTPSAVVERAFAELDHECIIGTVLNRVEKDTIPAVNYYNQTPGSPRYRKQ
jgi:capsular exopolysaccharide synthesis family protein